MEVIIRRNPAFHPRARRKEMIFSRVDTSRSPPDGLEVFAAEPIYDNAVYTIGLIAILCTNRDDLGWIISGKSREVVFILAGHFDASICLVKSFSNAANFRTARLRLDKRFMPVGFSVKKPVH